MRKLDLKRAFLRGGALAKNLQDQTGPVDHLGAERLFEIALLDWRDGAVDDHELGVLPGDVRGKSFDLPRTEQRGRTRGSNANHFAPNGLKRYRRGKTYRLIQPRFARTPAKDRKSTRLNSSH